MTSLCVHCHERPGNRARGLCNPCYDNPSVRKQYPSLKLTRPADDPSRPRCRRCRTRPIGQQHSRAAKMGLCATCRNARLDRLDYVSPSEPTEEELEAIIAEQMQNLPKWWHSDAQRYNPGTTEGSQ